MHELFYFSLTILYGCNQTIGCNWTVEAVNHTKSTQLNLPITELATITKSQPLPWKKKTGNFQNGEIFTLDTVSKGDVWMSVLNEFVLFSEIVMVMINW